VTLASRAQGATKYLKARLITTDATLSRLGSEFEARKLCTVRVVNIREPVELFELAPLGDADFSAIQQDYDKALLEFEHGRFKETVRLLGRVLSERPEDGPAQVLMSRAIRRLTEEPASFDSVWELPGE
jgi:hypothetical protein